MSAASRTPTPSEPETIRTGSKRVKCDGGGGALGHPAVYYDLGAAGEAECLYCDRKFVFDAALADGHDHH